MPKKSTKATRTLDPSRKKDAAKTPQRALAIARAFERAYQSCIRDVVASDDTESLLAVPGIVCFAFAIELGLKAIIYSSGRDAEGHNLADLFEQVSEPDRESLISYSGLNEQSFMANLHTASDTFVKWRYVYEHTDKFSTSVMFLEVLWFAVKTVASRK